MNVIRLRPRNALEWTVQEALEHTLAQVKSGECKAKKIYIAICEQGEFCDPSYAMAGMETVEAIGWLHLHMDYLLSSEED